MGHTKGKWKQGDTHLFGQNKNGVYSWVGNNRICIAECDFSAYRMAFDSLDEDCPEYLSKESEIANAKLIAVAPELLEALKELEKQDIQLPLKLGLKILHLIKKVEG